MNAGLRSWQQTGQGGFQPTPENIREWGEGVEATDRPKRKINPDCQYCGGTGFRAKDGRLYSAWSGKEKLPMVRCDCSVIVYRDQVYNSAKFQLAAAPEDRKPQEQIAMPKIPEQAVAKVIPSAYVPSEAELEEKKRRAFEIAEKFKSQTKGDIPSLKKN